MATPPPAAVTHKIIVAGCSGVGKTAIIQSLKDGTFNPDTDSTIGVDFSQYKCDTGDDSVKLNIWDTAGQEKFRSVSRAYFRNAVGAILVFALDDRSSFDGLEGWLNDIQTLALPNASIILVGNKSDLLDERVIAENDALVFANRHGLDYVETSAKECTNIEETFKRLAISITTKLRNGDLQGAPQGKTPAVVLGQPEEPAKSSGCC